MDGWVLRGDGRVERGTAELYACTLLVPVPKSELAKYRMPQAILLVMQRDVCDVVHTA